MTTQELRLGNYVYGLTDRIETIQGIGKMLLTKTGKLERLFSVECADVNPIPLTEQWLLDFGAIQKQGRAYFIGKLNFTYEHNELSQFVRFHYSGKVAYLQYVHQLQNLYFALTGTELTLKTEGK